MGSDRLGPNNVSVAYSKLLYICRYDHNQISSKLSAKIHCWRIGLFSSVYYADRRRQKRSSDPKLHRYLEATHVTGKNTGFISFRHAARHSLVYIGVEYRIFVRKASAMASNLPIPMPPRTPTPPTDDQHQSHTNSINHDSLSPLKITVPPVDFDRLSPTKPSFSLTSSPEYAQTPTQKGSGDAPAGPFNFDTVAMAKSPVVKSVSTASWNFTE